MMAVMCYAYLDVLNWFMTLPPEAMTPHATALIATVTGAMTGTFAVWLGHEKCALTQPVITDWRNNCGR